MASGREYLDFILEQLSGLDEVSYRPMIRMKVPGKCWQSEMSTTGNS